MEHEAQAPIETASALGERDDLTDEQFEALLINMQHEAQASHTVWTRNPGPKVPENHSQYRLRAENMPQSQKDGRALNVQTMGLGAFVQDLERRPDRDTLWAERAGKNQKQMEQMRKLPSLPAKQDQAIQEEEAQQDLQAERVKRIQEMEAARQRKDRKAESNQDGLNQSVKNLASRFGNVDSTKK